MFRFESIALHAVEFPKKKKRNWNREKINCCSISLGSLHINRKLDDTSIGRNA